MSVINTGVFANPEDTAEARQRSHDAHSVPLIGRNLDLAAQVINAGQEAFKGWLDALAVRYGLPPPGMIDGAVNHYGMSSKGEFTRYEPGVVQ